eukprot:8862520-Alexandrium_andersonii.AAC.1
MRSLLTPWMPADVWTSPATPSDSLPGAERLGSGLGCCASFFGQGWLPRNACRSFCGDAIARVMRSATSLPTSLGWGYARLLSWTGFFGD